MPVEICPWQLSGVGGASMLSSGCLSEGVQVSVAAKLPSRLSVMPKGQRER